MGKVTEKHHGVELLSGDIRVTALPSNILHTSVNGYIMWPVEARHSQEIIRTVQQTPIKHHVLINLWKYFM